MKENHPIDNLFREVILPYELAPSDNVWSSLDKKLQAKASTGSPFKINKIVLAGGLALGLLALLIGYNYFFSKNEKASTSIIPHIIPQTIQSATNNTNNTSNKNEGGTLVKKENVASVKTNSQQVLQNKSITVENRQTSNDEIEKTTSKTTSNYNSAPLIDKFEKTEQEPFIYNDKKDNSDKAILLLPYFPSDYAQNNLSQNNNQATAPPIKNESAEALNKAEKAENTIYVPNAFTPNGDGLNDVFVPQAGENIKEYKLFIFDRYSNLVFYSDEAHRGWDGRSHNNGTETIKEDVYMWRIEIKNNKGEKEHLMGYVNLLK